LATTHLEKIPLTTLRISIPTTWNAIQDSCDWTIFDRKGKVLRRGQDYLTGLPQSDDVEIVVPAAMVGFIRTQLPPGNQNKVLNALPFLVESELISAPEETHAVLVSYSKIDAQALVVVIQKAWLQHVLANLARAEIYPVRMFPETVLPELPNNGWALVSRGHESFVRTSSNQGFSLEVDKESASPPFLLSMALQQQSMLKIELIHLYGEVPTHVNAWASELGLTVNVINKQEWIVSDNNAHVNLLQGEFQPAGGVSRKLLPFKPVAIALLGLLVMQFAFSVVDYAYKAHENSQLDKTMVNQFKATFPNANTIVDAPLQMQRNLDDLKHGAGQGDSKDYLALLSLVTNNIGGFSADKIQAMDYQNGQLALSLQMSDMTQAQAMLQRLNNAGLLANIESSQQSAQGLQIKLVISAGAS
jgi:general secretion pathway protein L